jgi:hypothetical protein
MYNWMARSQRLITWRRLALGTVTAVAAPAYVLGAHAALVIWATTLVVTAASIYYCKAIIGGVVGDYIGVRGGTGGAAACSGAAEQHQGCGPVAARLARMRCEEIPPHPHSTRGAARARRRPRPGAAPQLPPPPGATISVTEIAIYLALGANWGALREFDGWAPLATLAAAMVVPVVWSRRIVDFC